MGINSVQSYVNKMMLSGFLIFTEALKFKATICTSNCKRHQAMNCILCWLISQTMWNHKTFRYARAGMTPLWRGMGACCNKQILNLSFPEVWGLWRLNVALESSFPCLRHSVQRPDQTLHAAHSLWQTLHTRLVWRKIRRYLLELSTYINSWLELKQEDQYHQTSPFREKNLKPLKRGTYNKNYNLIHISKLPIAGLKKCHGK